MDFDGIDSMGVECIHSLGWDPVTGSCKYNESLASKKGREFHDHLTKDSAPCSSFLWLKAKDVFCIFFFFFVVLRWKLLDFQFSCCKESIRSYHFYCTVFHISFSMEHSRFVPVLSYCETNVPIILIVLWTWVQIEWFHKNFSWQYYL
jgi:hypothetical protein